MSDPNSAVVGLKREIKTVRAKVRELTGENERWRDVARTLRQLAGLSDAQYSRLLNAASLPIE
ncbi:MULTISPECIES: hypothetical protein [unclassified Bradyrhizobium]|uniref:hypothetical protein n=1 Tax=unclassified Bradyrhizobium TaxID=2631580 RepID=UPI0024798B65|nr:MULTISPECIES: hypothetical protein [unclassified Bradyrhizobium]WGS23378.1 hypothetical protein MTX22_18185 [Bradyrhizobium sp. ISRA463]WGS30391.1 hypothetical protein MTX19_15910 [Bradyrhizobium sp. ISRA464]